LSNHNTQLLAEVVERYRPRDGGPNPSVAANGHDCRLPVYVAYPVSLDPRTGEKAADDLIVQCELCTAFWAVERRHHGRPDLVWAERRPRRRSRIAGLARRATVFNGDTAYLPPDPLLVDWSDPHNRPIKLGGLGWFQCEFNELISYDGAPCLATTDRGHAPPGGPMVTTTYQCVLLPEHKGLHESPCPYTGMVLF